MKRRKNSNLELFWDPAYDENFPEIHWWALNGQHVISETTWVPIYQLF